MKVSVHAAERFQQRFQSHLNPAKVNDSYYLCQEILNMFNDGLDIGISQNKDGEKAKVRACLFTKTGENIYLCYRRKMIITVVHDIPYNIEMNEEV